MVRSRRRHGDGGRRRHGRPAGAVTSRRRRGVAFGGPHPLRVTSWRGLAWWGRSNGGCAVHRALRRRVLVWSLAPVLAALVAPTGVVAANVGPSQPDVVLIVVDDAPTGVMDAMPATRALIRDPGSSSPTAWFPRRCAVRRGRRCSRATSRTRPASTPTARSQASEAGRRSSPTRVPRWPPTFGRPATGRRWSASTSTGMARWHRSPMYRPAGTTSWQWSALATTAMGSRGR